MHGSERARDLHREHPPIDLHVDSLMWARSLGYDFTRRHEPPLPFAAAGGHVDLPRLREGGLGAVFLGLVSVFALVNEYADAVDEQLDIAHALVASTPELALARSCADIEACSAMGQIALLLGLEGAHALHGSLARLAHFAARGVRYLGLVHFSANDAACPSWGAGRDDSVGLSSFGRDLVRACEDLDVLIDLAHVNRPGFMDACAIARRPVIVSHTGVSGAFPHWRNIDDLQLRAVADTGGVVGTIFVPMFLGGRKLEHVVRHVRHVIDVAGEDAAALGSDWDGWIIPTPDLRDASHLPLLTDALLDSGLSPRQVAKVLRGNALRVLRP
ncbi:MAG TPA: dipeptidase [Polyangiaceae bacterium]|nr:dipeptidase [Polyangiaceae bacterium]